MTLYRSDYKVQPNKVVFPHKISVVDETSLREAVAYDHVFGRYEKNYRDGTNWKCSDVLFADFDNEDEKDREVPEAEWVTLEKLQDAFEDITFYAVESKSHMKGKAKSGDRVEGPRPKYHVYFPIRETANSKLYLDYLKALPLAFPTLRFDKGVKDLARHFSATNEGAGVFVFRGSRSMADVLDEYRDSHRIETVAPTPRRAGSHQERRANDGKYNLQFPGYAEGEGRKVKLHDYLSGFQAHGWTDEEIREIALQANNRNQPPLGGDEIADVLKSVLGYEKGRREFVISNTDADGHPIHHCTPYMLKPVEHLLCFSTAGGQQKLLIERQNPESIISSFTLLPAVMAEHGITFAFTGKGTALTKSEYFEFLKKEAEQVDRFSIVPEAVVDAKTYYFAQDVKPRKTGAFRELMGLITTSTVKDSYRLAAGLLSAFLGRSFDGEKPAFGVVADSNTSGKTTAVVKAVKAIVGLEPIKFEGDPSKDEMAMGSIQAFSNPYAIIDNITSPKPSTLTSIARLITDRSHAAWLFGVSHTAVPNNKTIFLTFNKDESINDDVLARIVSVTMEGDITNEERIRITEAMGALLARREDVLADILYCFQNAQPTDKPVTAQKKYPRWAKAILPYVNYFYPEVDCFEFDLNDEERTLSADYDYWTEFCGYAVLGADADGVQFKGGLELYSAYLAYCVTIKEAPSAILGNRNFFKKWKTLSRGLRGRYELDKKSTGKEWIYTIKESPRTE
jgi:hypothetical protein